MFHGSRSWKNHHHALTSPCINKYQGDWDDVNGGIKIGWMARPCERCEPEKLPLHLLLSPPKGLHSRCENDTIMKLLSLFGSPPFSQHRDEGVMGYKANVNVTHHVGDACFCFSVKHLIYRLNWYFMIEWVRKQYSDLPFHALESEFSFTDVDFQSVDLSLSGCFVSNKNRPLPETKRSKTDSHIFTSMIWKDIR